MKKVLLIICAVAGIAALVAPAWSQSDLPQIKPALSTRVDLGYVTRYVCRGYPVNPDPAFQPSVTVSHKSGLSLNFWGSMDSTGITGHSGDLTEIDYTLNYVWAAKNLGMNAGLINYTFPNVGAASIAEAYVCAGLPGKLAPTVTLNYDFAAVNGYYLSIGSGYNCSAHCGKKAPTMGLSGKIGYGSSNYNKFNYAGTDKSGFTDLLLTAALPIAVNAKMTITPYINYSCIIDSTAKNNLASGGIKANNFFAGVTTSFSF